MLKQRRALTADFALQAGELIAARLCRRAYLKQPLLIASFIGCRGEVDTVPLNLALAKQGHRLCYPAVDPACPGHMEFYCTKGSLVPNRWGIPEPARLDQNLILPGQIDLMLLPLLAFDQEGRRLGMGGGYYDRYIPLLDPRCILTGIAYDFQQTPKVPCAAWDCRLHEVITPSRELVFG